MMSFRNKRILKEPVPVHIVKVVSQIDEYKGRQQLYNQQSPQVLKALREVAMVQSTESSNRIEGIKVPSDKLKALVAEKVTPANRSESEVAGYRDVLATVHSSYDHIPVKPSVILQLHRDLYKFVPSEGGKWKQFDNTIDDVLPDGTHVVRFSPVAASRTPDAMDELCDALNAQIQDQNAVPLLMISTFVLDFLCIHPFRDGNGRMSRLLTLLLLYQSGYEVGRYISLERIIEQSKESYYDALAACSSGWHEGKHTLIPWWEYFFGVVLAAYRELESRVGAVATSRGAKSERVVEVVERHLGDFSVSEVAGLCPGVSEALIRSILYQLKSEGKVECLGRGRYARWRWIRQR